MLQKDIAFRDLRTLADRKMMGVSWELRWFYPGQVPSNVTAWFENMDDRHFITFEEPRQDCQIPIPESDYLSVKLREQKLEIKWRRSKEESFLSPDGTIRGIAENWIKWTWIAADPEVNNSSYGAFCMEAPHGPTIQVAKERKVRRYQALREDDRNNNHYPVLRPVQSVPAEAAGCSMEITSVEAFASRWWSLALETFGTEKIDILEIAVTQLLSRFPGPPLIQENSYGYPHWLGALVKTKLR